MACEQAGRYYRDLSSDDYLVYLANTTDRKKIVQPLLSTGSWAAGQKDTHVVLGAPHPLLVYEDLSLSIELEELRSIFAESINTYTKMYDHLTKGRTREMDLMPCPQRLELLLTLQGIARKSSYNQLYKKSGLYFGSILKKSLASYKKVCAFVNQVSIDPLHDSLYALLAHVAQRRGSHGRRDVLVSPR